MLITREESDPCAAFMAALQDEKEWLVFLRRVFQFSDEQSYTLLHMAEMSYVQKPIAGTDKVGSPRFRVATLVEGIRAELLGTDQLSTSVRNDYMKFICVIIEMDEVPPQSWKERREALSH